MAVSISDIEAFHQFALGRVSDAGGESLTFEDLFVEWDSHENRDEINAAIRRGIADVDADRTRSAGEFAKELREKYKLPE